MGDGAETMETGEESEAGQEMAVVLHEVGQPDIIKTWYKKCIYLISIYVSQDKKYYPTAEEVYGPEVEVRNVHFMHSDGPMDVHKSMYTRGGLGYPSLS